MCSPYQEALGSSQLLDHMVCLTTVLDVLLYDQIVQAPPPLGFFIFDSFLDCQGTYTP